VTLEQEEEDKGSAGTSELVVSTGLDQDQDEIQYLGSIPALSGRDMIPGSGAWSVDSHAAALAKMKRPFSDVEENEVGELPKQQHHKKRRLESSRKVRVRNTLFEITLTFDEATQDHHQPPEPSPMDTQENHSPPPPPTSPMVCPPVPDITPGDCATAPLHQKNRQESSGNLRVSNMVFEIDLIIYKTT
jgi:hypothetical protein